MALLIGLLLASLLGLGLGHRYGLLAVRAMKPSSDHKPQAAIVFTFIGLLVLHAIGSWPSPSLTEFCWTGAFLEISPALTRAGAA